METVKTDKDAWSWYKEQYDKWSINLKKVKPKYLTVDKMDQLLDKLDLNFKKFKFTVYNIDRLFTYVYEIDDETMAIINVFAIDQFFNDDMCTCLLCKENMRKFELIIEKKFGNQFGWYWPVGIYRLKID